MTDNSEGSEPIKLTDPYFHLSKNEYGKMWLMYEPEGNGRYKCLEPITGEFWNEFKNLLQLQQQLKERDEEISVLKEALREVVPICMDAVSLLDEYQDNWKIVEQHKVKISNARKLIELNEPEK